MVSRRNRRQVNSDWPLDPKELRGAVLKTKVGVRVSRVVVLPTVRREEVTDGIADVEVEVDCEFWVILPHQQGGRRTPPWTR